MNFSLACLKFTGMFPRIIENDHKISGSQTCCRVGKISLEYLVFSGLSVLFRIILLTILFASGDSAVYASKTVFDFVGSMIWDGYNFVCELLTVLSVLYHHRKIKNCCNKAFVLIQLYEMSPSKTVCSVLSNSFLIPLYGTALCFIGLSFSAHSYSFIQIVLCSVSTISIATFIIFCRSSVHYFSMMQSKVHSLNESALHKLQAHDLSDPKHVLNIILYKKTTQWAHVRPHFERKQAASLEKRNHLLLIHLRLQEVLDSLIHDLVDSLSFGILIQLSNSVVTTTLGFYFSIKCLSLNSFDLFGSVFFTIYGLYLALAFVTLTSSLAREVSDLLICIYIF